MKKKIEKIIKKLALENVKFQKTLDGVVSKYNKSRLRQAIRMNDEFILELEATLS